MVLHILGITGMDAFRRRFMMVDKKFWVRISLVRFNQI
ncbi:hypothetical protein LINPERPRIM_LOCUS9372 [Linum perenne]